MIDPSINEPENKCEDPNCPFHGTLSVRGQVLEGIVTSSKRDKTVTVERKYTEKVPKFERYERRSSKLHAHNPPCIDAKEGDEVKVGECRKLSKQKSFVVIEKWSGD